MKNNKKLMIMAGGTGGHIFSGLAVSKQLEQQNWSIAWIGNFECMETCLVPKYGIPIYFIKIQGLQGKKKIEWIKVCLNFFYAVLKARKYIKKWKPDIVLGMGSYVSGPGVFAAWLSDVPIVLHEQNSVSGLTNKWLSKISKKVLQAFPGTLSKAETVGNPIRKSIIELDPPEIRMKERKGPIRILVIGGSQGALILNTIMPKVMFKLGNTYQVLHQVGKYKKKGIKSAYYKVNFNQVKVIEFIDNISEAYGWADLVVSRSGALTVSEIAVAGLPAIFIPFIHKDHHQSLNADFLVKSGAAKIIKQTELSVEKLVFEISKLNRVHLIDMAKKARKLAITDAGQKVANTIVSLVK
ncbi:undecaprenyldiphospho-muramoylpentapeptide beta-N-acetylglucosaminyltransferase [Candidatus Photodesmus anomalopis]|nr:undecaprenyldiphospho-muramoylpentapeptide beta-N-acetylglucosaminyltransferase [Candidatus Photodesmus katoptron]